MTTPSLPPRPPQPVRPAGWYPVPSGKPGIMFWDGQRWHADTSPAPAAATNTAWAHGVQSQVNTYMDKAQPQVAKARGLWAGLPRKRKVVFGAAGLLVAAVLTAVPVVAFDFVFGHVSGATSGAYDEGFNFGKTTHWYGADNCELSAGGLHKSAEWARGCEAGLQQAVPDEIGGGGLYSPNPHRSR
jgi:Protein of unknown function (DUF2510)